MDTKLPRGETQFPAMCAVTGEAIILRGTLIQLGEKKVPRPKPVKLLQVEVVPSVAFRFTVYRDQIEGGWSEVIGSTSLIMYRCLPCAKSKLVNAPRGITSKNSPIKEQS